MEIQILVKPDCGPCERARAVWAATCEAAGLRLGILTVGTEAGDAAVRALDLKALPAVLIDGRLVAVGVQTAPEAAALVEAARDSA